MKTLGVGLVLALAGVGCGGSYKAAGLAGAANGPAVSTGVLDCAALSTPENRSAEQIYSDALARRTNGAAYATSPAASAICRELGFPGVVDLDSIPGARLAAKQIAQAEDAKAVVIPIIAQSTSCQNESLALRDRNGAKVGSIDTGAVACEPAITQYRVFVFGEDGAPLFYKWLPIKRPELRDPAVLRETARDVLAALPVTVTAAHGGADAPVLAATPRAATTAYPDAYPTTHQPAREAGATVPAKTASPVNLNSSARSDTSP